MISSHDLKGESGTKVKNLVTHIQRTLYNCHGGISLQVLWTKFFVIYVYILSKLLISFQCTTSINHENKLTFGEKIATKFFEMGVFVLFLKLKCLSQVQVCQCATSTWIHLFVHSGDFSSLIPLEITTTLYA